MGGFVVKHSEGSRTSPHDGTEDCLSARSGIIALESPGGGTVTHLETPCLLLHTVKGCSPNVTWDGLKEMQSCIHGHSQSALGIQADVLQMCVVVVF